MSESKSVNVWLGSEIGILKGVNLVGKTATNYFDQSTLGKDYEISSTCWADGGQNNIYCGHKHGFIRTFNLDTGQFTQPIKIPDFQKGGEEVVKVYSKDNSLLTCTSRGKVALWEPKDGAVPSVKSNVGPNIYDFAVSHNRLRFATGGKENALKVYDIEKPDEAIFKAKNVPHDWLQLRVPIWVTGIKFLENSETKLVTSTGTCNVRLYDITGEQRRPCLEMKFDEYPLTSLALTHNSNQVVVANTRGNVGMFDFRKKGLVRVFKGFAGSVRCLETHPTLDYIGSCGLDRFLRIHDLNTGKLEYKVYLKARLNCLIFNDDDFVAAKKKLERENEEKLERKRKIEEDEEDDLEDPVWRKIKMVDSESDDSGSSGEE